MKTDALARVTAQILARHCSIHAFCRAHDTLTRATVYQVLSGRYAGNEARQLERIRTALDGAARAGMAPDIPALPAQPAFDAQKISETLQNCKCAHCRRTDRRGCRGCRRQTEREVQALQEVWE